MAAMSWPAMTAVRNASTPIFGTAVMDSIT